MQVEVVLQVSVSFHMASLVAGIPGQFELPDPRQASFCDGMKQAGRAALLLG